MKQYRATIIGDRYPMNFDVEASSWGTAANRAVKKWQERFKGSHTTTLKITLVRLDSNRFI